jgi:hypothetical protein
MPSWLSFVTLISHGVFNRHRIIKGSLEDWLLRRGADAVSRHGDKERALGLGKPRGKDQDQIKVKFQKFLCVDGSRDSRSGILRRDLPGGGSVGQDEIEYWSRKRGEARREEKKKKQGRTHRYQEGSIQESQAGGTTAQKKQQEASKDAKV